jgi:hypothetical protein
MSSCVEEQSEVSIFLRILFNSFGIENKTARNGQQRRNIKCSLGSRQVPFTYQPKPLLFSHVYLDIDKANIVEETPSWKRFDYKVVRRHCWR